MQIEIYLVGTGPRCVGDGFHHINSLIIYYGISCALTWFTSDPWLNNHNYHCGSLVVMELLSIFAQNKELAVAKWNEYFGNSEMLEED